MDRKFYYDTVTRMEREGVDRDYVQGWMGGYIGNPRREEQRVNEAYDAGYEDGSNQDDSGFSNWAGRMAQSA